MSDPWKAGFDAALQAGDAPGALAVLRGAARPDADYLAQLRLARALRKLERSALGLAPVRLALAADSTLDHFLPVLELWLVLAGCDPALHLAPYGTLRQSILDGGSALHAFRPDVVWLFSGWRDVHLAAAPGATSAQIDAAVAGAVEELRGLWAAAAKHSNALLLQNNADLPADEPWGNLAGAAPWGRASLLRRYDAALAAAAPSSVVVFDLDQCAADFGRRRWHEPRHWFASKHAFAFDAYGLVAQRAARLVAAARGRAPKCLVLDLDNTLWGGVVGDDGVEGIRLGDGPEGEAFVAFQAWCRELARRGVLLAVCSKNDPEAAREPFERHPAMRLRLDDFVAFVANWENKADNLARIAKQLELALDAFVFVDDNPAERELVRRSLPGVTVPELPPDPADYVPVLDGLRLFEALRFVPEDARRTAMYRENAERSAYAVQFTDLSAYLRGLDMRATARRLDAASLPRAQQLLARSNQFNLTAARRSEGELEALAASPDAEVWHVSLADRFGDNGLVSVLVVRQDGRDLVIDVWCMSCRVLARTLEEWIARLLLAVAARRGCERLVGLYVPTKRNGLVADLYPRLGFAPEAAPSGAPEGARAFVLAARDAGRVPPHHLRNDPANGGEEDRA